MNGQRDQHRQQIIHIDDRKVMSITAVDDVISFDEKQVVLGSCGGVISIDGEGLHIRKMNVDGGEIVIEGRINALTCIDKTVRRSGLFGRK